MIVVPQLCGHKQVLTPDRSVGEQLFERCANLFFVAVPLGTVEVAEPYFDRGPGGISRFSTIRNQRPKPKRRNLTVAIVQDKPLLPWIFTRCHVFGLLAESFVIGIASAAICFDLSP